MPTSIEELERVHLRFIKVQDELKLTDILSKILPKYLIILLTSPYSMLFIFLEPDLNNAPLDHPKI